MRKQHGFTLLELMVAMAIFAMLAVAGWQVFDSVNRARERAQFHADNLAVLQYAYLQLQQDMGQIIAYQAPGGQSAGADSSNSDDSSSNSSNSNSDVLVDAKPFMSLDGEHVSFVRFADPDPRYQTSTSVQRVEYIFADQRLIRRQYTSIQGGKDSISLDSVLLEGVTAGRWQAYLPEMSSKFPSTDSNNSNSANSNANRAPGQTGNTATDKPETTLLPKGVAVNFTYQDMPITWQWALAPQALPPKSKNNRNNGDSSNKPNSPNNNNEGSNNNTGNNTEDSNSGGSI